MAKKNEEDSAYLTLRIPAREGVQLKKIAEREDLTVSQIIRRLIREFLAKEGKQQ